ncbi:MAG TPA: hypothetical protein VH350_17850 [Candidatus Sulfotelmatobacter sp.]|jgi:hypothetical protein|nr:hypothetical protein [Candidatus Sulfotelmatobacter sp.]
MGNLVGLDLFLEVKTSRDPCLCRYTPAAQTQICQINSRKSELIASSPATQIKLSERNLYRSILGNVSSLALT